MKKISELWFADFETATAKTNYFKIHEDTTLNCWGIMSQDGTIYKNGTSMEEFFKFIKDVIKHNCYIYFHNLSYDGDFIIKWLVRNGYKAVNGDAYGLPNTFTFFRTLSKIYSIQIALPTGYRGEVQLVTFKCTLLLLSSSIQALGKDIGLDKYDNFKTELYDLEPKENINDYPQEYLDYLKRDVNIARISFNNFANEMENFIKTGGTIFRGFNWQKALTIGSISYEIQRRYILKNSKFKYCFKINKWTYDVATNFYFGGFTQFNPKYQNEIIACEDGISLDINSAHPFSMTKLLPISKLYNIKKAPIPKNKPVLEYYELRIGQALANQDALPCLINWKKINKEFGVSFSKQRYVFRLEDFTAYYLKEEWELMNKFYDFKDVKILNHYWAIADYPLKDFTDDLYEFKLKHKKNKHKAGEQTYKILLNSAYGKHATREKFGDFYICDSKKEYDELMKEDTLIFKKKEHQILKSHFSFQVPGLWALPVLKVPDPKFLANKLIASTITAWSRIYLLEACLKLGLENFLYCDTDSIYLKKKPKNLENIIKLDDYQLGAWKIEHSFNYMYVQGAKCYVIANDEKLDEPIKSTYSGINKGWLKRNYNPKIYGNFDDPLYEANLKKLNCPSGLVIVGVDYQPKRRSI